MILNHFAIKKTINMTFLLITSIFYTNLEEFRWFLILIRIFLHVVTLVIFYNRHNYFYSKDNGIVHYVIMNFSSFSFYLRGLLKLNF